MKLKLPGTGLFALVLLLLAGVAQAKVQLPRLFSDGAVLQRDQPLRIWGTADAGAPVHVDFNGSAVEVVAGADGRWSAMLPAQGAGGPYQLTVRSGNSARSVRDLLVGDVWLASGQSNMEWPVASSDEVDAVIASAGDTQIRHFKIPKSWSEKPEHDLVGGDWVAASPQTVANFSAVGYAFARELRAATGVPIGIIDSSWGGSNIQAWMSAASLGIDEKGLVQRMQKVRDADQRLAANMRRKLARLKRSGNDESQWHLADHDDRDWAVIRVPGAWEYNGWPGMDGIAWYRTTFTLAEAEARQGATLALGPIDDSDQVWVNGQLVGGMTRQWSAPRQYPVPAQSLQAGVNSIAVRVVDDGGGGGITGNPDVSYLQLEGGRRQALAGDWRFRPYEVRVAIEGEKNQIDTLLYNQMIHPLQPIPLRGVIWYQGEANAGEGSAYAYRDQFATMIKQWRSDFQQPGLPFLWVQLANFISGGDTPTSSSWAMLRESQSAALALPATGQGVIIDVGDPGDIHPTDKQTVGHRLALAARHVAYGESLVYSGPVFKKAHFAHGMGLLEFDLGGSALAVRGGGDAVQGFQLAGADGVFHPASATISGKQVVVQSDAVPLPIAVRYAWRDNPEDANLTNRENLPASPFRSDTW